MENEKLEEIVRKSDEPKEKKTQSKPKYWTANYEIND